VSGYRKHNLAPLWHCFILPTVVGVIAAQTGTAQSGSAVSPTGPMMTPRAAHTATLLANGKVLIAGGASAAFPYPDIILSSAELYDPVTRTFNSTGKMTTARAAHNATLLADGRVLLTGGSHDLSAEIYDPAAGSFSATGPLLTQPFGFPSAVLLSDGRVFVAGTPTAQLYDPVTARFNPAASYAEPAPRFIGGVALLADGKVLLTGGSDTAGWSEVYDPATNSFRSAGGPNQWDDIFTVTPLPRGEVLYVGNGENDGEPADAETFDPANLVFGRVGQAAFNHEYGAATLLPNGTVLVTGGQLPGGNGELYSEIYASSGRTFSTSVDLLVPRHEHTSTLLPDGTVLISGGFFIWPTATESAEVYRPETLVHAPSLFTVSPDGKGQGAIWHALTGKLASFDSPAVGGEILSLYTTTLIGGGLIPPQISIAGQAAEIVFFGDAPGYPGFNQVNFRVPARVSTGPSVPVRLMYLGRSSNEVSIALQ
jgi:hypothetical protein